MLLWPKIWDSGASYKTGRIFEEQDLRKTTAQNVHLPIKHACAIMYDGSGLFDQSKRKYCRDPLKILITIQHNIIIFISVIRPLANITQILQFFLDFDSKYQRANN